MPKKLNNTHAKGNENGTITRRNARRHDAELRQAERDERSPQEQLARLNEKQFKATRERTRLVKQIGKQKQ